MEPCLEFGRVLFRSGPDGDPRLGTAWARHSHRLAAPPDRSRYPSGPPRDRGAGAVSAGISLARAAAGVARLAPGAAHGRLPRGAAIMAPGSAARPDAEPYSPLRSGAGAGGRITGRDRASARALFAHPGLGRALRGGV